MLSLYAYIARASGFYQNVFGWNIRKRSDASISFDDATGEVSGACVVGRPPTAKPGLYFIMVDSVAAALGPIVANGDEIVQPISGDAPEITARFRDPSGNVIDLYPAIHLIGASLGLSCNWLSHTRTDHLARARADGRRAQFMSFWPRGL